MVTVTATIISCLFVVVSAAPSGNPVCDEPMPLASCEPDVQATKKWQYHYAQDKNECVAFIYGGCRGGSNNFATKEACEQACQSQAGDPQKQFGQLVAIGTQTSATPSAAASTTTSTASSTTTSTASSTITTTTGGTASPPQKNAAMDVPIEANHVTENLSGNAAENNNNHSLS